MLRICSQHILSQSQSPKIGRIVAGMASGVKNILGCMAGLALAQVAAAGQQVVIQRKQI